MIVDEQAFMRWASWTAAAIFALGLAACDPSPVAEQAGRNSNDSADAASEVSPGADAAKSRTTVDDLALNIRVEDALKEHPELGTQSIRVMASGAVVTLSGTVDTAANRDLAGRVAAGVEGVEAVQNKLAVADI
ncbi:MAG: BON domain-containing protein [Burkholderiales bacterium]|nr:BON domain-containing protein [Burkholderiales bacterium]